MEELPLEALLHIFSFFDDWHDLDSLSRAFPGLHDIIFGLPCLWRDTLRRSQHSRVFVYTIDSEPKHWGDLAHQSVTRCFSQPTEIASLSSSSSSSSSVGDPSAVDCNALSAAASSILGYRWDWVDVCMSSIACQSLFEALVIAAASDCIAGMAVVLLLPGTHAPEGVVISEPVVVVGLNNSSDVDPRPFLTDRPPLNSDAVFIGGTVHVRGSPQLQHGILGADDEAASRRATVLCGVSTRGGTAIDIRGCTAALVGCHTSTTEQHAVICRQSSTVVMAHCLVDGSQACGVAVSASNLACWRTRVTNAAGSGLFVLQGSSAKLAECQVDHCKNFGVFASSSHAVLQSCGIHHTGLSCIVAREGAELNVVQSRLYSSAQCGALIAESGALTAFGASFLECGITGVEIREDSHADLRKCVMNENKQHGLSVGKSTAKVDNCEVRRNGFSGVTVRSGGRPDIVQCLISENKSYGMYFAPESAGFVSLCHITGNDGCGIRCRGAPTVVGNRIERNNGGLLALEDGAPIARDNSFANNEVLPPSVALAVSRNHCTFFYTGAMYTPQWWMRCETCSPNDTNEGCCIVCAETCHKGHKLGPAHFTRFYCDCFTHLLPGQCKAVPSKERADKYHLACSDVHAALDDKRDSDEPNDTDMSLE